MKTPWSSKSSCSSYITDKQNDVSTQVDEAVAAMKERKAKNASSPGVDASLNPQDFASEGLRLRTEMQRAVDQER